MSQDPESDGQIYTLGLIEQLKEDLFRSGSVQHELYFKIDRLLRELANPNLHDVNLTTAFRIELWDRHGKDHLRMCIAASSNVAIAHAAFDAAVKEYARDRLTLRKGIMLIRDHKPK
jgi:hypothetical protein